MTRTGTAVQRVSRAALQKRVRELERELEEVRDGSVAALNALLKTETDTKAKVIAERDSANWERDAMSKQWAKVREERDKAVRERAAAYTQRDTTVTRNVALRERGLWARILNR